MQFTYTTFTRPHSLSTDPTNPVSWIQIGKTGSFTSQKYGKFQITTTDFKDMIRNFVPGRIPLDYDHLSNAPQRPGDGVAAGWIEALELRNNGSELWALATWTTHAAERIRNNEYKYTSPSFSKNSIDTTTGEDIGTMLHCVAMTNRPFLSSMAGLALCADDVVGHIALSDTALPFQETSMTQRFNLSKIGDKVSFSDDELKTPELTPKERADTYVVKAVVDANDQQFVRLAQVDNEKEFGWFSSTQLAPANAPRKAAIPPAPMEPVVPTTPEAQVAQSQALSMAEANQRIYARGTKRATAKGISLSQAIKELTAEDLGVDISIRDGHVPVAPTPISLASTEAEVRFFDRVMSIKAEHKIGDLEAINLAQELYPEAAQRYADGDF